MINTALTRQLVVFAILLAIAGIARAATPIFMASTSYQSWTTDQEVLAVPGYVDQPYNVIAMGFLQADGTPMAGMAVWADPASYLSLPTLQALTSETNPTNAQVRTAIRVLDQAAGVTRLVSLFGAADSPIGKGNTATTVAAMAANYVATHNLDGVVVDWSETSEFYNAGTAETWLGTLTTQLRANIGSTAIIGHAPYAYYFSSTTYPSGGYLTLHDTVGTNIDWYAIRYHNAGTVNYDSYSSLVQTATDWATHTSILELNNGTNSLGIAIPSGKIVVGKPATPADTYSTGYVSASSLTSYLNTLASSATITDAAARQYDSDMSSGFTFGTQLYGGEVPVHRRSSWWYALQSHTQPRIIITC
jgi:hypothetical protein